MKQGSAGRILLYVIHWAIIINFAVAAIYAAYMVFVQLAPSGGGGGPLWSAWKSMPKDQLVIRRLYANEFWQAMIGLSLYVAVTEIAPRFKRIAEEKAQDRAR